METMLPKHDGVTPHQQMRAYGNDLLRRNVIEAASQLLRDEGPEALTVRRVAEKLEGSTKIIYTMFKGKDGLADALYLEGCARLVQAIQQVPRATTPAIYLHQIAQAYWAFAQAYPSYYMVMFCGAIPRYQPSTASIHTTTRALEIVAGTLQHYVEQGLLSVADPILAAKVLWAPLHGVVSLFLTGYYTSQEEARTVFECAAQATIASLLAQTPS